MLISGFQDLAETAYADTWPQVVNSAAQLIRWTDETWGAVANVLGGGTSINGGLYIEEEPDYFQERILVRRKTTTGIPWKPLDSGWGGWFDSGVSDVSGIAIPDPPTGGSGRSSFGSYGLKIY